MAVRWSKQVITIELRLDGGISPYSNEAERNPTDKYNHLVKFFEELDPRYKVLSIYSSEPGRKTRRKLD